MVLLTTTYSIISYIIKASIAGMLANIKTRIWEKISNERKNSENNQNCYNTSNYGFGTANHDLHFQAFNLW